MFSEQWQVFSDSDNGSLAVRCSLSTVHCPLFTNHYLPYFFITSLNPEFVSPAPTANMDTPTSRVASANTLPLPSWEEGPSLQLPLFQAQSTRQLFS